MIKKKKKSLIRLFTHLKTDPLKIKGIILGAAREGSEGRP